MKCQQSIDDPLSITRCPKKSFTNLLQPRPPHFQLGYSLQVNLVRPVRQPQRPRTREHPRQRGIVAHAQRTVDLNRRVDHRDGGSRSRDLKQKNDVRPIARTRIKINSPLQAAIAPLADLLPSASSNLAASNVASLAPSNRTRILPRV